jgi:diketogulonate reductase-like aldo/keto reductase
MYDTVNEVMMYIYSCDYSKLWMRCDLTQDREATWEDSWLALEKAYAEGKLMAIGVSNFDIKNLHRMSAIASTLPHVVHNFAEPGDVDEEVQNWCKETNTFYQAYGSLRNLQSLSDRSKRIISDIASAHNVSPYAVVLRYFIQTGNGVVPHTDNVNHQFENMRVFDFVLTPRQMTHLRSLKSSAPTDLGLFRGSRYDRREL